MNLSQALRILPPPSLRDTSPKSLGFGGGQEGVALVGSGGKTTALFQLARQLPPPVMVTATTHLHVDQINLADSHWVGEMPEDFVDLEKNLLGVMLVTGPVDGDRTKGLNNNSIYWLRGFCGYHALPLLIEADGSHQHPLKAPAEDEPPVPEFVETVVVVAGLSGLGKPLTDEFVHRPEIFSHLSGLALGDTVTPDALFRVLTHPAGGLKSIPVQARRVVLLNQADTLELQSIGGKMAQDLLAAFDAVLVGALERSHVQTFERTAGIILAAGEAKRFGQPKQLLDYHGQPFVRTVTKTALASGLSPVVVLTGANAEQVEAAVKGLSVTIVRNTDWQNGQSSSIQAGLHALTPSPLPAPSGGASPTGTMSRGEGRRGEGAAIFLLADQPQVTPTVIRALMEQHAVELAPIIAPLVAGQRANPVLFDRMTFPDLMALTGDVGGRAIFSKYPVTYLTWHDESLLVDIDTPDDLKKFENKE